MTNAKTTPMSHWLISGAALIWNLLGLKIYVDTVGATTLRPEHVTLHSDGVAEFRFLGKDSVLWHKKLELPEVVQENLDELIRESPVARYWTSAGASAPGAPLGSPVAPVVGYLDDASQCSASSVGRPRDL